MIDFQRNCLLTILVQEVVQKILIGFSQKSFGEVPITIYLIPRYYKFPIGEPWAEIHHREIAADALQAIVQRLQSSVVIKPQISLMKNTAHKLLK